MLSAALISLLICGDADPPPRFAMIAGLCIGDVDPDQLTSKFGPRLVLNMPPNRRQVWRRGAVKFEARHSDRGDRGVLVDVFSVHKWRGKLKNNWPFRRHGSGIYGDLVYGSSLADSLKVLQRGEPQINEWPGINGLSVIRVRGYHRDKVMLKVSYSIELNFEKDKLAGFVIFGVEC